MLALLEKSPMPSALPTALTVWPKVLISCTHLGSGCQTERISFQSMKRAQESFSAISSLLGRDLGLEIYETMKSHLGVWDADLGV